MKHVERDHTSFIFSEFQETSAMKYHFTPMKIPTIFKKKITTFVECVRNLPHLHPVSIV